MENLLDYTFHIERLVWKWRALLNCMSKVLQARPDIARDIAKRTTPEEIPSESRSGL